MGKIAFFSLLCVVMVVILSYLASQISGQNQTDAGNKNDAKNTKGTSSIFSDICTLIIFGLVVYLIFMVVTNKYDLKNLIPQPQQIRITVPENKEVLKHGALSWEKPRQIRGRDVQLRKSEPLQVTIHRNDASMMIFTARYSTRSGNIRNAEFQWDKRNKYGTWSQSEPQDSGLWYLLPCKSNRKVFVGEHSTVSTGEWIPTTLVITD